jgi:hypothetical protein
LCGVSFCGASLPARLFRALEIFLWRSLLLMSVWHRFQLWRSFFRGSSFIFSPWAAPASQALHFSVVAAAL